MSKGAGGEAEPAGGEAEDYIGPLSPHRRDWKVLSGEIPAQIDALEFVKQHALDPNSQLFRPSLYKKAPVFARKVKKYTMVKNRPKVCIHTRYLCALKLQLHFFVFGQASPNPIEFTFFSPAHWVDEYGNPCKETVSIGDYLSLILKPVVKSDGTESTQQGELYQVEGAAFDNTNRFLNRFEKVCAKCKKTELGFSPFKCTCDGGCQPFTLNSMLP